jgi:hypothetical protein
LAFFAAGFRAASFTTLRARFFDVAFVFFRFFLAMCLSSESSSA